MRLRSVPVLLFSVLPMWSFPAHQTKADTPTQTKADTATQTKAETPAQTKAGSLTNSTSSTVEENTTVAPQSGVDRPAALLPANSDTVTVKVQLRGLDAEPKDGEIEAGILTLPQPSTLQVHPVVKLLKAELLRAEAPKADAPKGESLKPGDYLVTLTISGLVAFGESNVSLWYKNRQVETLRFLKVGLIAKPTDDEGFIARQAKGPLLLVLENASTFEYKAVQARLRFENQDVCLFRAETFGPSAAGPTPDCLDFRTWTAFDIPRYAQVTLSSTPADGWFVDPTSGLARSGKRKGLLTVRFSGPDGAIYEQSLPLEVDFQPSGWASFTSISLVAIPILFGALFSIFLRISLPNLKRRRQLKNQLNKAAKATAAISTAVDSNLRVLLRVERLELRETLKSGWWFGPNDTEFTQRVERALPGLEKRIDGVRQLDAALIRRGVLVQQGIAPTRLEQIDNLLDPLGESLKQEQLTDEDWVSVNQRIEALRKLLREPTSTEKEAIEAMLAGRWQEIRDHFGMVEGRLKVPDALKGLANCFPEPALLPGDTEGEKDGVKWVKSIGAMRADLQLTALKLAWDFQFLAPGALDKRWQDAEAQLDALLATPSTANLLTAKSLLRQLASGVSKEDIEEALKTGMAEITLDPPSPSRNQKIRYAVHFFREDLNNAVARELVSCRWHFKDEHPTTTRRGLRRLRQLWSTASTSGEGYATELDEVGWATCHYLETGVTESLTTVSFHDSKGLPIVLPEGQSWSTRTIRPQQGGRRGQWAPLGLEMIQLGATLLVPLATLASTTANGGSVGHWWQLLGIGFGADTIKNLIAGTPTASPPPPGGTT